MFQMFHFLIIRINNFLCIYNILCRQKYITANYMRTGNYMRPFPYYRLTHKQNLCWEDLTCVFVIIKQFTWKYSLISFFVLHQYLKSLFSPIYSSLLFLHVLSFNLIFPHQNAVICTILSYSEEGQ